MRCLSPLGICVLDRTLTGPSLCLPLRDSSLDFETLLEIGLKLGGPLLHVSAPEPITPSNIHTVFPTFHILDPSAPPFLLASDSSASLTSPTYTPELWIPVQVARDNFKLAAGANINSTTASIPQKVMLNRLAGLEGPTAFDTWTTAWGTIDPAETHETINTVDAVCTRHLFIPRRVRLTCACVL